MSPVNDESFDIVLFDLLMLFFLLVARNLGKTGMEEKLDMIDFSPESLITGSYCVSVSYDSAESAIILLK